MTNDYPRTTGLPATAAKRELTVRPSEGICQAGGATRHQAGTALPIHDADELFEGTQPFGMRSSLRTGEALTGRRPADALNGARRGTRLWEQGRTPAARRRRFTCPSA